MNKMLDYTQIKNEVLKDSISDFLSILRDKSADFLKSYEIKTVLHSEYAEVYFEQSSQVMMEDLVENLVAVLGIHVLYAVKSDDGKTFKAVAYSVPVENSMYIIYLSSQQYGIVDSMTVCFYDSLDIMYKQVCNEYTNVPKQSVFVLEKEQRSVMVSSFI